MPGTGRTKQSDSTVHCCWVGRANSWILVGSERFVLEDVLSPICRLRSARCVDFSGTSIVSRTRAVEV